MDTSIILTIIAAIAVIAFLPEITARWLVGLTFLWKKGKAIWTSTPGPSSTIPTNLISLILGTALGAYLCFRILAPPVPPDPGPGPTPPGPTPTPQVDPIPGSDFRVLILEETADRQSLTPSQLAILDSTDWPAYVTSKSGQHRVLDIDLTTHPSFQKEAPWVKSAVSSYTSIPQDRRLPLPVLIISKGATGEITSISPSLSLSDFESITRKYGDR